MPQLGYKDGERQGRERRHASRSRSGERGHKKRSKEEKDIKKDKKDSKRKRDDGPVDRRATRDVEQIDVDAAHAGSDRGDEAPNRFGSWREELEKTDAAADDDDDDAVPDGIVAVETDEDVDKKIS